MMLMVSVDNVFGHGVSDGDKHGLIEGGLIDYLFFGAKHMVTGYDHILFLIGVMFFLTKFSDIVKFITAFTLGHSITLIFATYYGISANYYLIDAVIALSIIYKGFENLDGFRKWFSINAPNLILMVFLFGLVHGFGLSTRLQQLPLGDAGLLRKIISFNVGVELGQIIALSIIYPILGLLRSKIIGRISFIANSGLIFAGSILLIFQLSGYFTTRGGDHHHEGVHHQHDVGHKHNHNGVPEH